MGGQDGRRQAGTQNRGGGGGGLAHLARSFAPAWAQALSFFLLRGRAGLPPRFQHITPAGFFLRPLQTHPTCCPARHTLHLPSSSFLFPHAPACSVLAFSARLPLSDALRFARQIFGMRCHLFLRACAPSPAPRAAISAGPSLQDSCGATLCIFPRMPPGYFC